MEYVIGMLGQYIQQAVHEVYKSVAEMLQGHIPLPVPVGVGDNTKYFIFSFFHEKSSGYLCWIKLVCKALTLIISKEGRKVKLLKSYGGTSFSLTDDVGKAIIYYKGFSIFSK